MFWRKEWDSDLPEVTDRVRDFYEKHPFPDYDEFDDVASLVRKSREGIFAKRLDEEIPYGIRILDCGCGTGQLTNFLSIAQRHVFGVDMCLNSLKLAQGFKVKNGLNRAHFLQMNIFSPIFKPESFDMVISNGVLHHTGDPFLAFKTISALVKPRGYILIGLYHRYGRIFTDLRRHVFRQLGNRFRFLDPRLVNERIRAQKREAWFEDQYRNPHESKHTIGEILNWFQKTGFDFVKSIPRSVPGGGFRADEKLFLPEKAGNAAQRFLVEFPMILQGAREGGFFTMIGRRQ